MKGEGRSCAPGWPRWATLWTVLSAGVIASLIAAWGMKPGGGAEPNPAQVVVARFPAARNNASIAPAVHVDNLMSRFFFNPQQNAEAALKVASVPEQPEPATDISSKPKPNRNAVFNDAQIASLRDRLKLTAAQKPYWLPVEEALRALTWRRGGGKNANRNATIDTDSPEVQRLRDTAPALMQVLRDEQKREVYMIARLMGVERLVSQY